DGRWLLALRDGTSRLLRMRGRIWQSCNNWPRLLRWPHLFISLGKAQHTQIIETLAENLQADGQSCRRVTAIDRNRRLFRHVHRHGEGDMFERALRIVDR